MADNINVYITTFNCGRALVDVDYFSTHLFHGLKTDLPPDLIVLSLQEIAPLAYSFLGGSLLAPYFGRFATAINDATTAKFGRSSDYSTVIIRNVGMTAIMVFARHNMEEQIRAMKTAGVGVGWWDMGNKGAVGVRLGLGSHGDEETLLTFVAAHLAPMEDKCEKRNADWRNICEGLVFENVSPGGKAKTVRDTETEPLLPSGDVETPAREEQESSMFRPISNVLFAGDLNYRTSDTPPDPDSAHLDWPQPVADRSDPRHYSHRLPKDQLTREREGGRTLHLLDEAPVDFPPTYKYSSAAQARAAHAVQSERHELADGRVINTTSLKRVEDEDEWLWAKHRTPSWCDRILFLAASPPSVNSYAALPVQPTSDHRPVALSLAFPRRPVTASIEPPFAIAKGWRERRAVARRYEIMVGLASYLSLTWEGEALLVGTVVGIMGGYIALRTLLATT